MEGDLGGRRAESRARRGRRRLCARRAQRELITPRWSRARGRQGRDHRRRDRGHGLLLDPVAPARGAGGAAGRRAGRQRRRPPAVELSGIDKRFGPVHANKSVDLKIARRHDPRHRRRERRRQVDAHEHPLRLLPGRPRGDLRRWQQRRIRSPDAIARRHRHGPPALHAGRAVHGPGEHPARRRGRRRSAEGVCAGARRVAAARNANTRLEVAPTRLVGELPVGVQQRVEILKALYRGARILILDEPTASRPRRRRTTCSISCTTSATRASPWS